MRFVLLAAAAALLAGCGSVPHAAPVSWSISDDGTSITCGDVVYVPDAGERHSTCEWRCAIYDALPRHLVVGFDRDPVAGVYTAEHVDVDELCAL